MFEITPTQAFMIYLAASIAIIMVAWLFQHLKVRKSKIDVSSTKLRVCEFCLFTYLAPSHQVVTQCERCRQYNKNNEYNEK